MDDPDTDIRLAAFSHLRALTYRHGSAMPWAVLKHGFQARGHKFLFASAAEGIFRPAGMTGVLSLKTVVPKPKGRIWYHDQSAPELETTTQVFSYAFTGADPDSTRNRWLRDAMTRQLPLIYFYGIAPGVYEPLFPAFVVEWNPEELKLRSLLLRRGRHARIRICSGTRTALRAENHSAAAAPGNVPGTGAGCLGPSLRSVRASGTPPDRRGPYHAGYG